MSNYPKITVITVCYNAARTIGITLRSVSSQTYTNIEHIVIDGKSSDSTLEVLANEGKHLSKIISEKDEGIYDAMNKGLNISTGDIVAFLNADDYYKNNLVLEKISRLMIDENLDAIYGDVDFFKNLDDPRIIRRYDSSRFAVNKLPLGLMPAHPALFVRKNLFESYGYFNKSYKIAGDFELILRFFKDNNISYKYLPESLVCMQMGGISTSGWRATLLLNTEIIRACRSNKINTGWLNMIRRYIYKLSEFT